MGKKSTKMVAIASRIVKATIVVAERSMEFALQFVVVLRAKIPKCFSRRKKFKGFISPVLEKKIRLLLTSNMMKDLMWRRGRR